MKRAPFSAHAINASPRIFLFLAILLGVPVQTRAGEQLIGTSCSGNTNNVDWDTIGQCVSATFQRVSPFLAGSVAIGATSMTTGTVLDMGSKTNSMLLPVGTTGQEPTGVAGMIRYNSTNSAVEFYNGTSWQTALSVGSTGYFVLTKTTWNGNLGGLSGADAKCLTEIGTTNTGWVGYSTANSNGQLVASKVHAFLCYQTGNECNILEPNTTYYFANANDGTAGGASFTTNSNGYGPSDSANWSGSTYFNTSASYWTGISSTLDGTATLFAYTASGTTCNAWTATSAAQTGPIGSSNSTTATRWIDTTATCATAENLICYVNP